jgi:DNA repair protein RadA/Sms
VSRPRTVFRCSACDLLAPRWAGRCSGCSAWNTLTEELAVAPSSTAFVTPSEVPPLWPVGDSDPVPLSEIDLSGSAPISTGLLEFDLVLDGGFVPGSVTVVGGEPGIGKSTLLLQVLLAMAGRGTASLLVSAEESAAQVRHRADRIGGVVDRCSLLASTELVRILEVISTSRPGVVVVDSIQTISDPRFGSTPGSTVQVRECANTLAQVARQTKTALVLIGHVTKDGSLAGPRSLEHLVDTVLDFEGDRHHSLRLLSAVKHRFGATGELGIFQMTGTGLRGVVDPSRLFLEDRSPSSPGTIVVPTMEGRQPLLVELQALVAETTLPSPRRAVEGIPAGRLALLLAVLQRHLGIDLQRSDVFSAVTGGIRVTEPAADLALGLCIVSAVSGRPLGDDLVACAEVGLAGELRQVPQTARRLTEAARLGFKRAVVPASTKELSAPIELLRAATLADAVRLVTDSPLGADDRARRARSTPSLSNGPRHRTLEARAPREQARGVQQ